MAAAEVVEAPLLTMVEAEGRGRSLVAASALKAGEVVLKDSPILLYSAFPLLPAQSFPEAQNSVESDYCSFCFRFIPKLHSSPIPCPGCSSSLFCSLHCQSLAFSKSHTPWVCQSQKRLKDASSSPLLHRNVDLQVQARFLIAAYNLAVVSPPDFQTLLSLQGDTCVFFDSAESRDNVLFLHRLLSALSTSQNVFSLELIAALLAKDKLNAFGLMEPFTTEKERSVRAYGIYPRASFFNHDCLPNACRFDYVDGSVADGNGIGNNTDMIVRMIHDVPQGREICLSYFPVNFKYSERQRRLKEDYGFLCDCDRCKVEANWSDNEEEGLDEDGINDGDVETAMDEDENEEMVDEEEGDAAIEDNDFPHAYFFLNYMCNKENCWGTLAPLPPSGSTPSMLMECNVCGSFTNSKEFTDGNSVE